MQLIDSHCHLDFNHFDRDRAQVLAHCVDLGIEHIVIPGVKASDWLAQVKICQANPMLKAALGLHPYFLEEYQPQHMDLLESMLMQYKGELIALGEIGLDKYVDTDFSLQLSVFERQLILAQANKLPVILHQRKTSSEILSSLTKVKFEFGGVLHGFSGSYQVGMEFIRRGFKLGIGGVITYNRAKKTRQAVAKFPIESLVLETDSPDMPLFGRQGKRNSPVYLPEVLSCLSQVRGVDKQWLADQLYQNTCSVFNLKVD